jgi:hypothetical protein
VSASAFAPPTNQPRTSSPRSGAHFSFYQCYLDGFRLGRNISDDIADGPRASTSPQASKGELTIEVSTLSRSARSSARRAQAPDWTISIHSFRDTLVRLGKRMCRTPEEFEAWSKNLGHEHMLTTFRSYGSSIDLHRQGELIKAIGRDREDANKLDQLMEMLKKKLEPAV